MERKHLGQPPPRKEQRGGGGARAEDGGEHEGGPGGDEAAGGDEGGGRQGGVRRGLGLRGAPALRRGRLGAAGRGGLFVPRDAGLRGTAATCKKSVFLFRWFVVSSF